ncbi:MAG: type II/IV secretion system ATPase subunit [Candidatus Aenigmarchaeota archaeon]|nr:type II/IV secretion system ATPase subunit [Candidatus Aenigmarchaeota archaeon]
MPCEYTFKNNILKIDCMKCIYSSSIEDFPQCMSAVINHLMAVKDANAIILVKDREYEYDFEQTQMLVEIARAIERSTRDLKTTSYGNLVTTKCDRCVSERLDFLRNLVLIKLKSDPVGAYVKLIRKIRHLKVLSERTKGICKDCYAHYLNNALIPLRDLLEETKLIRKAQDLLPGYKVGERTIYRQLFIPSVRPRFTYTKYMATPPDQSELIDSYKVTDAKVEIYRIPREVRCLYQLVPIEFRLEEDEYNLLDKARRYMANHRPMEREELASEEVRQSFYNIGLDMLREIASQDNMTLEDDRLKIIARVLVRYTAGIGILELILSDDNVQDVYVNAPPGTSPIYLLHGKFGECRTNIVLTPEDAELLATRLRLSSGRPLDEANPVLDTELSIPGGRARICAIMQSLSPGGLGFALRRHRERPWTMPLFLTQKMMTPLAAGLLWFIVDGGRTLLVGGTRSAGKTSLLAAIITQIMKNKRIISVEDTLELPLTKFRELGYNVTRLKSRSVITMVETELPAEEALRVSLRLGDSCLIIGEVRSKEALALYEAMRIGAMANVVAGTIHGDSAFGLFDRVVNDLKVPPTSFKATDLVVINNSLKSADGMRSFRRTVEITEVRKHWQSDPAKEKGFINLMEYNAKTDELEPTPTLLAGESELINSIARNVKEWRNEWDSVWGNITLRANVMKTVADMAIQTNNPELMEANTVVLSNNMFHIMSENVKKETGTLDTKEIYQRWLAWFKEYIKTEGHGVNPLTENPFE